MEDEILTEFVTQTRADAALAHDLLEAAEWNLDHALHMYEGFMNTQAVQPEDQISEFNMSNELFMMDCLIMMDLANELIMMDLANELFMIDLLMIL